jgi:multiple sugar transport system substrate-binding protein
MAHRFEAAEGISVEFMISSGGFDGFRTKLLTMVAGGLAPEVTDAHPMLAAPLIAQGVFADLTPYIQRDEVPLDRIPPVAVEGVRTPDRQLWGIPVSLYPVVTFFNVDIFAEHGVPNPRELGAQWTWETLVSAAKKLTIDADGDGTPEFYGTEHTSSRWEMQVHQAGGQLYDRIVYPTKSQFNSLAVLRAVEFIQNLYVEGLASNNSLHRVYNGNAAFSVVGGPGDIGSYYKTAPFAWDIARQPLGPANRAARVNPDGFQLVAQSKHRDEAWRWIHFLVTDTENQLTMARITGRLPSLKEAMVRYQSAVENSLPLPDNWQALIETTFDPDGYAAYVIPNASAIDAVVNPIMSRVWNGQASAAVSLQQIHEILPSLLN